MLTRRELMALAAAAPALAQNRQWQAGDAAHLLPTASHDRILLKASFRSAHASPPSLRAGRQTVKGTRTDTRGFFWRFDITGLAPETEHLLQLADAGGRQLCDPWMLRTLPAPDARPERFRLLYFTCAGGDERLTTPAGEPNYLPLAVRRRLLRRALAFDPHAAIANGDHIYWDLRQTGAPPHYREDVVAATGRFIRTEPALGGSNEDVLKRVCEQQILRLYGTDFRAVPVFFTQDDHDYFENDDANETMVTFPPDHFMLQLGRATRRLCFPEFLPDPNRPAGLPGASAPDTPPSTGESYGTLRFGRLAEVLLYDCRRYLTLAGPNAVIVPREVEQWLKSRMADGGVTHVVHAPSMPPVWSAGKWGDWYPDILGPDGKLTTRIAKPYYQPGWTEQHDRIMQAASAMTGRTPLYLCGDMHAHAEARVMRAGAVDLSANPPAVFLSGAIGTRTGWPSRARRVLPAPATHVRVDERQPCLEENGFLIVEFAEGEITVRAFRWSPKQPEEVIDTLEPFRSVRLPRASAV
jgi:hypothetical protein